MESIDIKFYKNTSNHHFEIEVIGVVAFVEYFERYNEIELDYMDIPEPLIGTGILNLLIEKTLGYIREHHQKLVPVDSLIQRYVQQHPEYRDIVKDELQVKAITAA